MKKTIKVNETTFKQIVAEFVKNILKHSSGRISEAFDAEGTDKQNSYLQYLAGDEWDDNWKNLSVKDTSAKIDYYRNNPAKSTKNQSPDLATEKQLNYIRSNKYYPLPFIDKIKDKLTKKDASQLCSALTPFTDDVNYYGYRQRIRHDYWFPVMVKNVIEILSKYGLNEELSQIKSELDTFNAKMQIKQDKMRAQQDKENAEREKYLLANSTIVFASSQNDAIENVEPAYNIYLHGIVEAAMGWDLVNIVPSESHTTLEQLKEDADKRRNSNILSPYNSVYCKVIGYDKPCIFYYWTRLDYSNDQFVLTGVILDKSEHYKYKEQCETLAYDRTDAGYITG